MTMEPFYRTSYGRALHSLVISGFWERDLDADDLMFLEYVRARGTANGSLPSSGAVLIEELEFWHLPFTTAPGVDRRPGPPPRGETPERKALREAKQAAWQARQEIRRQQAAIAEAEMAREQREWEAANAKRRLREQISDAEWEAAAPRNAAFGTTVNRHHVPQWKLDAQKLAVQTRKLGKLEAKHGRKHGLAAKRKRKKQHEQQLQAQEIERLAREQQQREAAAAWPWQAAEVTAATDARRQAEAAERERRERIIAEAKQTVARVDAMERERKEAAERERYGTVELMKTAIVTLMRGTGPYVWTRETLTRSLYCANDDIFDRALLELAREGRIRAVDEAATKGIRR